MSARPRLQALRLPLTVAGAVLTALLALVLSSGGAGTQSPPAAPTIDSVTAAATSLTVAWTAPPGVTGITAYDVRHIPTDDDEADDANWIVVDSAWTSGNLEYAITGLAKGTGYDVQVRAVTTLDGLWSATTAQTTLTTVPGAPTIEPVSPGEGSLGVLWSAPADTGGAAITAYDLRYSETGQASWTEVDDAWAADDPTPTRELTRVIDGLTAGTAYDVQVRAENSEGTSDWSATVTGTPVTDHGDDRAGATTIALGSLTSGSISTGSEYDWFKLVLATEGEVALMTRGELDTVGRLYDANGNRITTNDDGYLAHGSLNFAIGRRLAAGSYYLRVRSFSVGTGDYLLQTLPIADTTGRSDADLIEPGTSVTRVSGARDDQDWYRLDLTEQTDALISGVSWEGISGRLLDANGEGVTGVETVDLASFDFVLRASLAAGTYYVRVEPDDGPGVYQLRLIAVAEPGDTRSDAAPITLGKPAGGSIGAADDVDYFRIDVSETTYVRATARGARVVLSGTLLDADGDPAPRADVYEHPDEGRPAGFRIEHRLDPGTYYIEVTRRAGSSGPSTGSYALSVEVDWFYTQFIDRCAAVPSAYSDPLFGCQWHLVNSGQLGGTAGEDLNVERAWSTTQGAGINVAVVDSGLQPDHEDLEDNIDASKNHDYTGRGQFDREESHGTSVAGVIAARDNDLGVRGVAPRATVYSFNLLQDFTDANSADAMTREMATTAVSNNSWSAASEGRWTRAPSIWELAIERGIAEGYGGKGVSYVFSAGNEAYNGDNSNHHEGRSHYGLTIACAVNDRGKRAGYSEPGANLWGCAPSSDRLSLNRPGITTTTSFRYRPNFGGTSSAAPSVSGVAALVRAANTSLTWRDVKLILAGSARKNDPSNSGWRDAGAVYGSPSERYHFNHFYGFGVVDAAAAVDLAGSWTLLPPFREKDSTVARPDLKIPDHVLRAQPTKVSSSVTLGPYVEFVEFVEVNVNIQHESIRHLLITLTSPSGTVSSLSDTSGSTFVVIWKQRWNGPFRFGSARHLGEDPAGTWTLTLWDWKTGSTGTLRSWSITVYGHGRLPDQPSIDTLTPAPGALTAAWSAPDQDTGEPAISAYDLRYIRTDATDKADANWTVVDDAWTSGALEYTISGLPGDVSYDVQVRARNSAGDGDWSETIAEKSGLTPPSAPAITSVVPGNATLAVSWDAPTDTGGQPITAYDVQHRTSGGAWTVVDSATTGARRYTLSGLANGTVYDVQVRAVSRAGDGDWSQTEIGKPRAVNAVPAFDPAETGARSIAENTPAGADIGAPVAATDADQDRLTYTISGSGARFFEIDAATGQLRTKEPLDHETRPGYSLTVTATDVAYARTTQGVTITVTDVNEPPTISGPQSREHAENSTSAVGAYRVTDPERVDIALTPGGPDGHFFSIVRGSLTFTSPPDYENPRDQDGLNTYEVTVTAHDGANTATHDVTVTVTNVNEAPEIAGEAAVTLDEDGATFVGSYSAIDPEGSVLRWTLGGADRGDFSFADGDLFFASTPDFEAPLDANRDNVYQLELQASDGTNTARLRVTVTVNNLEETGEVTLSARQPQVGVAIRAALDDPDGRLSGVSWQWQGPPGTDLGGATSASYTPVASDVGNILRATVSYTDGHSPGKGAHMDSTYAVRLAPATNAAPAFPPAETGVREVRENTRADEGIGASVAADDPDNDPLTYTLDSTGATFFDIDDASGQLRTKATLDHESRPSYRVTVTATDPSGLRDTQQVTITVTDEDESPMISGDTVVFYPSGGTRTVATYRADDPERETITWSLSGLDSAAFEIDGGRLRFVTPPDHETPTDAGADNVYELTVAAEDPAANRDSLGVTVAVREGAPPPPPIIGPIAVPFFGGGGGPSGPEPSDEDFEWTVTHDLDALDEGHTSPTGMWSDGATLWLADNAEGAGDAVLAYPLASGERSEEREFALDEQNRAPRGVWSDGVTVWVSDSGRNQLFAYDLAGGERLAGRDLELTSRNRDARGAWGSGGTIWVLDGGKDSLFAYDLDGGALLAEYELVDANSDPRGIWSDGVSVWVSDHGAKRLYAYRLPEPPEAPAAEDAEPVALDRSTALDFTELSKASNLSPRGIWSDGAMMYVADANDGKVYTYNMPDAIDARLASLTLEGVEVGEFDPGQTEYEGVTAEGVTRTTVAAEAAQAGATVAVEPADADEEAEGHQVDLAGVEEVTVTVTSEDASRQRTYRVRLTEAGPSASCLRGDVDAGFSLVVFEGGTVDDLVGCAESRAVTALYALHEGEYVSYILGAPELVNAPFRGLFADGVPALTPLTVRSEGPPSPDPSADSALSLDWPECLRGEVAAGFSLVVFEGGTVEELVACAESRGVSAVYALAGGEWVSYILGAPEFVNAPFGELFAEGVPVATPLVVRSDGAQSTGAAGEEPEN